MRPAPSLEGPCHGASLRHALTALVGRAADELMAQKSRSATELEAGKPKAGCRLPLCSQWPPESLGISQFVGIAAFNCIPGIPDDFDGTKDVSGWQVSGVKHWLWSTPRDRLPASSRLRGRRVRMCVGSERNSFLFTPLRMSSVYGCRMLMARRIRLAVSVCLDLAFIGFGRALFASFVAYRRQARP